MPNRSEGQADTRFPSRTRAGLAKRASIYPFVFVLFPVLSLYLHNEREVPPVELLPTVFIVLGLCGILLALAYLVFRSAPKASLAVTLLSLLVFSHHHVIYTLSILVNYLQGPEDTAAIVRSRTIPLIWLGVGISLFLVASWAIQKSRSDFRLATAALNAMALCLAVVLAVNWLYTAVRSRPHRALEDAWAQELAAERAAAQAQTSPEPPPDIYYIIIDGYARADILETLYGVDNADFLSFLVEKGFYVAGRSTANYGSTGMSLTSSLNYEYLDDMAAQMGVDSVHDLPLQAMLKHNRVVDFLGRQGYALVSFATGFSPTEMRSADRYLAPRWNVNDFQNTLIRTTSIPVLLELPFLKTQYDLHRDRILYTLEHLVDASQGIHPSLSLPMSLRPILILQADHGPGSSQHPLILERSNVLERLAILNAYYFPDRNYEALYPDITPVNTFRVVLNTTFGTDLELLEDRNYASAALGNPLTDVTHQVSTLDSE
jgi:hypothetical protein